MKTAINIFNGYSVNTQFLKEGQIWFGHRLAYKAFSGLSLQEQLDVIKELGNPAASKLITTR